MSIAPKEFEWSYKPPVTSENFDTQTDWNQTLITKFNQIVTDEFIDYDVETHQFFVPRKYQSLIESLEFYNKENGMVESAISSLPEKKIEFTDDESVKDILLVRGDYTDYLWATAALKINNWIEKK